MIQLLLLLAHLVLLRTSCSWVIKLRSYPLFLCWRILGCRSGNFIDAPAQLLDVLLSRTGSPWICNYLPISLIVILCWGDSLVLLWRMLLLHLRRACWLLVALPIVWAWVCCYFVATIIRLRLRLHWTTVVCKDIHSAWVLVTARRHPSTTFSSSSDDAACTTLHTDHGHLWGLLHLSTGSHPLHAKASIWRILRWGEALRSHGSIWPRDWVVLSKSSARCCTLDGTFSTLSRSGPVL